MGTLSLSFFPVCFTAMSLLRGTSSCCAVLEHPALSIVLLPSLDLHLCCHHFFLNSLTPRAARCRLLAVASAGQQEMSPPWHKPTELKSVLLWGLSGCQAGALSLSCTFPDGLWLQDPAQAAPCEEFSNKISIQKSWGHGSSSRAHS